LRERHVASIRTNSEQRRLRHTVGAIHELVMDVVGAQGLAPAGPFFARLHRFEPVVDVEAGIPLAQPIAPSGVVRAGVLPGGLALRLQHAGDHARLHEAWRALDAYVTRHGLRSLGAPWEFFVVDGRDSPDPNDWLTEIYLPVARRSTIVAPRPVGSALRTLSASQAIR
jgi:effector-binding domain-containing protein